MTRFQEILAFNKHLRKCRKNPGNIALSDGHRKQTVLDVNSLGNCPNCGARMADQTSGSYTRTVCPVCEAVTTERYEQDL